MATIKPQQIKKTGTVLTYAAATALGDTLKNTGNDILHVKNASGASITVTVASITPCDQGVIHPVTVVVAAGAEAEIGPFEVSRFGRDVAVSYTAVTSVTVAAASL